MNSKNQQIKELINNGLSIVKRMSGIRSVTPAGPNTNELITVANTLYPLIQNDYPLLSSTISNVARRLIEDGTINAFFFGDMRTSLKVLKEKYCRAPKIFISHKSEDEAFVKALVKLLRLYIGSEPEKIFCSSVPTYKIGIGKEIFPEIKSQFEGNDVFMIIVHSPRYYQSSVCLNEMGAAWIQDTECYSFLTADCKYDDLQ